MTREDQMISKDRMRYTKDKLSSLLVLLAILFDALYFVSIYQSDVGTWYYTWVIGASIIYNLLFMLTAFLCSEGVKNRKNGYSPVLLLIGVMQVVRMFYLPAKAHASVVVVKGEELAVMDDRQYAYALICLAVSAVCCLAAAVTSYWNNKKLNDYLRTLENQSP